MRTLKYEDYTLTLGDPETSKLSDKEFVKGDVVYDMADSTDGETVVSTLVEHRITGETDDQLYERMEQLFHNWVDDGAPVPEMSPEDTLDNDDMPKVDPVALRDAMEQTCDETPTDDDV